MKKAIFSAVLGLGLLAHAGFYTVEPAGCGAWRLYDPAGREIFLNGVDHVKWTGHRSERTASAAYFETNRKKYAVKAAWETNTLHRLREWGFNLLGAGCDNDLRHRGLAHTVYLNIGGRMAKAGGDLAIRANPADVPCGGFPNVFSPEWEMACARVAEEMCKAERGSPDLLGYFIDNELAWWGDGAFDLACGLFDCTAKLPPEHSAKKALEDFLRQQGVDDASKADRQIKTAFLSLAAERYFSVAAAAIRRVDPDHLVLGCRFAGLNGAGREVWAAAGRHCDIVSFNCYPWVDLDRNVVMGGAAMQDVPFADLIAERSNWSKKPFMITEWSFPALDSGLPCMHGAGQRFRTQAERSRATELFLRAMRSSGAVVAHSYFMWVDEPYFGIRKDLPEDSNYGLVNENDEPYPLVEVFAGMSRENPRKVKHDRAFKVEPAASSPPAVSAVNDVAYAAADGKYRLSNRFGLELHGCIGGKRMFDRILLRGVEIGSWNAMLAFESGGRTHWRDAEKVTRAKWDKASRVFTVTAEGGTAADRFSVTHEISLCGDKPSFVARVSKIKNLSGGPLALKTVYFRQYAPYAASTVKSGAVPHLWNSPHQACWNDPRSGKRWGGWTYAKDTEIFLYYINPSSGSVHPDAGFSVSGIVLKPDAEHKPKSDGSWMVAEAYAPAADVDPFVGTAGTGHTFPGATRPFAMVQPGPDTGYGDWQHCSGYRMEDAKVLGFSQTHLSGTGCSDLGDFLLLPFTGELPHGEPGGFKDRRTETAWPGYYSVELTNFAVKAEITSSKRVAFHRWTFPKGKRAKVVLDMQYGAVERSKDVINTHVLSSTLNFGKDGRSVSGGNVLSAWLKREVYFTLAFQRRWKSKRILPKRDPREKAQRVEFVFDLPDDGILEARIAVSTVDAANARRNLLAEGKTSFEQCREAAAAEWNGLLSRADIKGAGAEERKIFKTGLYHLFIQPNDIADVDGRYRGADGKVHAASSGCYYTGFSLWDTFRAAHPLYTVLTPEKVDGFVNSMLEQYRAVGYLPVIPYFGSETFCMIGNHSVPVIVDAYLKGFRGFDAALAFEAVTNSLTVTHPGKIKEDWKYYDTLGYYPYDVIKGEGVSRTMECAYDDSCAARFAAALGKDAVREFFRRRSGNWRNVFDSGDTMLVRGRDSKGAWRTPFDPRRIGGGGDWMPYDCTEANAWQYTWHVLHDPAGLAAAFGGAKRFGERLDMFFSDAGKAAGSEDCPDASGNYGQYAHGNEPSHHIAYLYNWTDKPEIVGARVREIAKRFYSAKPDGICGNDDCGQMDAWYVFAALGFYPVDPCGGEYVLGAPLFKETVLNLPGGKTFTVLADAPSDSKCRVRNVFMNGRKLDRRTVDHESIVRGGELVFDMMEK